MIYKIPTEKIPDILKYGRRLYNSGWQAQYCRESNAILFIIRGQFIIKYESGETVTLSENEYMILPQKTSYTITVSKTCDFYFAHFMLNNQLKSAETDEIVCQKNEFSTNQNTRLHTPVLLKQPDNIYIKNHGSFKHEKDEVLYLCSQCEINKNSLSYYSKLQLNCDFYKILIILASLMINNTIQNEPLPAPLSKAILFIHQNYNKPITSSMVCEETGYTQQYVSLLFKKNLGRTVTQYINLVKLQNSLELLRHTMLSINEISYFFGFENPYYYCRIFKREFNITPTEYRRLNSTTL